MCNPNYKIMITMFCKIILVHFRQDIDHILFVNSLKIYSLVSIKNKDLITNHKFFMSLYVAWYKSFQIFESNLIPPFPRMLQVEVTKKKEEESFDILDQLKHKCVKIPLFQAIKYAPIYGKAIKESCLKKLGRRNVHRQSCSWSTSR